MFKTEKFQPWPLIGRYSSHGNNLQHSNTVTFLFFIINTVIPYIFLLKSQDCHFCTINLVWLDVVESCKMTYFCRPAQKLASPWFPRQKPDGFSIAVWMIIENKYVHVLFIKIIFTNKHTFYERQSLNIITWNKKLTLGYKRETTVAWLQLLLLLNFQQIFILCSFKMYELETLSWNSLPESSLYTVKVH